MKIAAASLLALICLHAAIAPATTLCGPGQITNLQSKNCAAAQRYVARHHYQGKPELGTFFTCEGAPVAVNLDDQNCPNGYAPAPWVAPTRDDLNCVIGIFCRLYPNSSPQ